MEYELKITGSGSIEELIESLTKSLRGIKGIRDASVRLKTDDINAVLEDATLLTQIKTI